MTAAETGVVYRVQTPDTGKVIREENTGRTVGTGEKLFGKPVAAFGIVVITEAYVILPNPDSGRLTGPIKPGQAVFGDGGLLSVEKSEFSMAFRENITRKFLHAPKIIRENCDPVVEQMVDGHHREIRGDQLDNHRVFKIDRGDYHAVYPAVKAVLEITAFLVSDILVDERDVVAFALGFHPDAVQDGGEKLMSKTAASSVHKEDADVVASVRFQHPCGGAALAI